ncbi:MAG TPA: FtsX-like permease family protein [Anaerolineae bacterium]|nr:FtsX-like permease family protein [Anaerolineae bacterium]
MLTTPHLVFLTSLRHIRRHKLRTVLTLLGVIAGVATFIFAPSLSTSITDSLRAAVDDLAGQADLEVRGPNEGFRARTLAIVRSIDGVRVAAPLVQAGGLVLGEREPLAIFGIDPRLDRDVRVYALAAGRWLERAGDVLLAERYAREKDIALGQSITLIGPGGALDLKLAGLLAEQGIGRLNGGDVAVMRVAHAQALRGDERIDSIAIRLQADQPVAAVADRLRAVLPDSLEVDTPETRRGPLGEIQGVVTFMMTFISVAFLSLGSTLVFNTMAVAVAQRRAEIGVLRALGVSRSGVQAMFLLESSLLGLIGALLGIPVGYALVDIAGSRIDLDLLFSSGAGATIVPHAPNWLPFLALIFGVALPTLAGYLPARAAARVEPVEALSGAQAEAGRLRVGRRTIIGLSLLAIAGALLLSYAVFGFSIVSDTPYVHVIGAALIMLAGMILILPAILIGLGRVLPAWMHRAFGVPGLLAAENLTKRPKRMVATATVLLIAAWAAVVVSSSNFGYRSMIDEWNASENVWSLTISGAGPSPFKPIIGLPDDLPRSIAARPEVAATVAERITTLDFDGGSLDVRAIDLARYQAGGGDFLWEAGDRAAAFPRLQDTTRPAVLLSSFTALTQGLSEGDTLILQTPRGPQPFEIVGSVLIAVEPGRPGTGGLVMDLNVYRHFWRDRRIDRLLVQLEPGRDTRAVRRAWQENYGEQGLVIASPADLAATFTRTINASVVTSQVMSGLLLLTMLLGIGNTFVILALDRRREMGMLRAIGLYGRQVAASLVLEAALLAVITGLLAIPMGLFNNYANSLTIQNIFGIRFVLAPGEVAAALGLVIGAAALAAFVPARQAARVDVLEALRYE